MPQAEPREAGMSVVPLQGGLFRAPGHTFAGLGLTQGLFVQTMTIKMGWIKTNEVFNKLYINKGNLGTK